MGGNTLSRSSSGGNDANIGVKPALHKHDKVVPSRNTSHVQRAMHIFRKFTRVHIVDDVAGPRANHVVTPHSTRLSGQHNDGRHVNTNGNAVEHTSIFSDGTMGVGGVWQGDRLMTQSCRARCAHGDSSRDNRHVHGGEKASQPSSVTSTPVCRTNGFMWGLVSPHDRDYGHVKPSSCPAPLSSSSSRVSHHRRSQRLNDNNTQHALPPSGIMARAMASLNSVSCHSPHHSVVTPSSRRGGVATQVSTQLVAIPRWLRASVSSGAGVNTAAKVAKGIKGRSGSVGGGGSGHGVVDGVHGVEQSSAPTPSSMPSQATHTSSRHGDGSFLPPPRRQARPSTHNATVDVCRDVPRGASVAKASTTVQQALCHTAAHLPSTGHHGTDTIHSGDVKTTTSTKQAGVRPTVQHAAVHTTSSTRGKQPTTRRYSTVDPTTVVTPLARRSHRRVGACGGVDNGTSQHQLYATPGSVLSPTHRRRHSDDVNVFRNRRVVMSSGKHYSASPLSHTRTMSIHGGMTGTPSAFTPVARSLSLGHTPLSRASGGNGLGGSECKQGTNGCGGGGGAGGWVEPCCSTGVGVEKVVGVVGGASGGVVAHHGLNNGVTGDNTTASCPPPTVTIDMDVEKVTRHNVGVEKSPFGCDAGGGDGDDGDAPAGLSVETCSPASVSSGSSSSGGGMSWFDGGDDDDERVCDDGGDGDHHNTHHSDVRMGNGGGCDDEDEDLARTMPLTWALYIR